MRLGVFGGAFDPIHNGHLLLAEQCREQCQLDEVWFVPTRTPPHKDAASLTDSRHRVEMLKLAIAGQPEFKVSHIELDHDDVSWTAETLRRLRDQLPDDELFLLIGGDSLRDFPTWREPHAITEMATVVAVNRGDVSTASDHSELDNELQARVQIVNMRGVDISATDIRNRVTDGKSIRFLVPRAVDEFIRHNGLYSQKDDADG